MAVCQVCETTLYYRGLPASGGLLDPLMGTVDRRHLCATCQNDARGCQGHPGYMSLSFPMYHIGFVDTVLKILRVTCFCCSRICITDDEIASLDETNGRSRLTSIHNAFRMRKTCPHCDMTRPAMTRVPLGIKVTWPAEMQWESDEEREYCTSPFTARDALSILRNIPHEDLVVLGFSPTESHPMNMIVQNMVVPPPCTRPAVYSSEGSRSRGQNDLTMHLLEVLKRSHEVANFMGDATWKTIPVVTTELMERLNRLQYEVFMLVNNNARIAKPAGMGRNSSNANGKSIHERLKGKEGRVRGNLMGKRVDFSARCVITPDAWFECDRVGVPHKIAMTLTFPETVNSENMRHLSERVRIGTTNVQGAQNVIHADGCVTDLGSCKDRSSVVLRPGDVVERFLADDDIVVFNRQPSLHMHGMQAHRVRLMPGHTFRLSLVVAAPYNADFDGDEMNLHVPQSKAASAECASLMAVAQNALGSQSNRPVMGIVQDSLLGLYLMTQSSVLLDHSHACRIVGHIRHAPRRLPPPAVRIYDENGNRHVWWTGRQIFSLILSSTLYVENDAMLTDLDPTSSEAWMDPPVTVRKGELVTGVLRKAHVGTGAGGIVDTICREMDGVMCMRFMGDAQRITHEFLLQRGHHVGIHDVMLSHEGHVQVTERLEKATILCEEIQREIVHSTPHERQQGEEAIMRLLSKTLLQTGGIVNEHMDATNSIRRMVTAGSKGSFINLSQICAALGQQSLEGGRIVAEKGTRTLPCFAHNDLSLASRGMVQNSFSLGLSPPELFFHAVGGREGLVDTAVKTSQSGYISRRMNKSMEDNVVRPGGIICTSMDDMIAPQWGSDGFHPARVERVKLVELKESEQSIRSRMGPEEADMVLRAVAEIRLCKFHPLTGDGDARVLLPYNTGRVRRLMHRARTSVDGCDVDDVKDVMARVFELVRDAPKVVVASLIGLINSHTLPHVARTLADDLLTGLEQRIEYARSTACESVGCIAAQSISERGTQLTLNTFHSAGVSAKNVTLGIPRFKEILDASKTPKTPCTTLRFVDPLQSSATFAEYMANTLPLTRLSDIVKSCNIINDPDPTTTVVAEDAWIVEADNIIGYSVPEHSSNLIVRVELLQEVMRSRHLTPTIVRRILAERLMGRALVSSSEANSLDWIIRIRFHHLKDMIAHGNLGNEQEAILCHCALNVLLDTVVISGHPKITGANASEDANSHGCHVVHAYGNVLLDASASEAIDWERSTSNDMWEVYHTLGIEAAAHVIFEQMKAVVAFDGTYVDDRHILLIVDNICRGGTIMPLNRHGINKTDNTSPLMRCSFEETMDVLCEAAGFAQSENARGVSTSIMTGQLANMGTGACEVLFPQGREVRTIQSIQTSGRVMRSSCRSYTKRLDEETLEYVTNQTRPSGMRPLSPPTVDERGSRKRARFRMVSPRR